MTMDRKANAAFYGNPAITPEQIFAGTGNLAPAEANTFVQVLSAKTSQLPQRPGTASRQSQPQQQSRSEVRTYGMNANPDEEID